jgi:polar amino acid transport system substrate-binding protein
MRPLSRPPSGRWSRVTAVLLLLTAVRTVSGTAVNLVYSQQLFRGTNASVTTVRVCVTLYPPFVLPATFVQQGLTGVSSTTVPTGVYNASASPVLGYDVEYAALLFTNALGIQDLRFVVVPHFLYIYLYLRTGQCDAAMGAAELDLSRSSCATCPSVPAGGVDAMFAQADYTDGFTSGQGPQLRSYDCCLDYSIPYYSSTGFGLATKITGGTKSAYTSLVSPAVVNVGLALALIVLVAGWLMVIVEYKQNAELTTVAEGVFFALTTVSTVGFGDINAKSSLGRVVVGSLMVASLITTTVFTSVLSAAVTTAQLTVSEVNMPSQLDGALPVCVETDYPLAVATAQDFGLTTVTMSASACMQAVEAGTVQAFLDDVPVLSYWTRALQLTDIYISPTIAENSFAVVYPAGSPVRQWANTAILATRTDPTLRAISSALWKKYFSVSNVPIASFNQSLNWSLLGAVIAIIAATIFFWGTADIRVLQEAANWVTLPVRWTGPVAARELQRRKSMKEAEQRQRGAPIRWELSREDSEHGPAQNGSESTSPGS